MALRVFPPKIDLNRIRNPFFKIKHSLGKKFLNALYYKRTSHSRRASNSAGQRKQVRHTLSGCTNHVWLWITTGPRPRNRAHARKLWQWETSAVATMHRVRDYSRDPMGRSCRFRGHSQRQHGCPAFGMSCHRCGRKNHFAACYQNFGGDSVKYVQLSTEQEQDVKGEGSSQCVNTVATNGVLNVITIKLMLDGKVVKFQVDSGATCDVVRLKDLHVEREQLQTSSDILQLYDKSKLNPLGRWNTELVNPKDGRSTLNQLDSGEGRSNCYSWSSSEPKAWVDNRTLWSHL